MNGARVGLRRRITAGCTLLTVRLVAGTMIGWPSPMLRQMKSSGQPKHLTSFEITWVVSLLYISSFISTIPVNYLMDLVGKKTCLIIMSVFPLCTWLLIIHAEDAVLLCVGRFLGGVWYSIDLIIPSLYLAEITEPKLRSILQIFLLTGIKFGIFIEYVVGTYVSYEVLAALSALFPLCIFLQLWNLPESPGWLISKNNLEFAAISLSWLKGDEKVSIYRIPEALKELQLDMHKQVLHPKHLLTRPELRKALFIVQILAAAQRLSGISAVVTFLSMTLPERGIPSITSDHCIMIIGSFWTVLTVSCLVYRCDRKPLLYISLLGCGVGHFITGTWFFLDAKTNLDVSNQSWLPFLGIIIYSIFFSIGIGPVPATVMEEMFSPDHRTSVSVITTMTLALSSFVTTQFYLPIADYIGMYINYLIFCAVSIATALFVGFVVVETRNKTLSEIHENLIY